jgi:hypothetical protein
MKGAAGLAKPTAVARKGRGSDGRAGPEDLDATELALAELILCRIKGMDEEEAWRARMKPEGGSDT